MPSKIESGLTPEQFWDFCQAVAKIPGGRKGAVLREIQRLAAEWDIGYISTNSAKSFRDGAFHDFLEDLKADRDFSNDIATVAKEGSNLPDAAAHVLSKKIFKTAMKLGDDIDPNTADAMTKSVERLRTGFRNARRLDAQLAESEKKRTLADEQIARLQREKSEWDEQRRKIVAATEQLRTATPASADDVRSAAVAEIDRIMGIKNKPKTK